MGGGACGAEQGGLGERVGSEAEGPDLEDVRVKWEPTASVTSGRSGLEDPGRIA